MKRILHDMKVSIEIDSENDLCYIGLIPADCDTRAAHTLCVTEDIALDFDEAGRLLGIEVMNASKNLPNPQATL